MAGACYSGSRSVSNGDLGAAGGGCCLWEGSRLNGSACEDEEGTGAVDVGGEEIAGGDLDGAGQGRQVKKSLESIVYFPHTSDEAVLLAAGLG